MYCHFLFSMFVDNIFSATPLRYVKARLSDATVGRGLLNRPDSIAVCRDMLTQVRDHVLLAGLSPLARYEGDD